MKFTMEGKANWKYLLIVIILAAIVGGVILARQYWWMPKEEAKDETADWKTYRNEEYGFEIKYPEDWELEGEETKGTIAFYQKKAEGALRITKGSDTEEALEDTKQFIENDEDVKDAKEEEIFLDNVRAVKLSYSVFNRRPMDAQDGRITGIFIKEKNLRITFDTLIEEKYFQSVNQILSTFRFLE